MAWDPVNNDITNKPEPDHPPDKIGGTMSDKMAGRTFFYRYPSGLQYKISFNKTHVYFTIPPLPGGADRIALKYRARELREDQFLVHWMGPGRQAHIALVFDLQNERVDGTALMPGYFELFDRAEFVERYENGEHALYEGQD